MKDEPKHCSICGELFLAKHSKQHICYKAECRNEAYRIRQQKYRERNTAAIRERKSEQKKSEEVKDTIIAIGYAERQKAQTLKMVGKVQV